MKRVEHIGIAVRSLDEANRLFANIFKQRHYKIEAVTSEGVNTSFFKFGDTKVELLEATDPHSPIAKFIEKRGPGVHHIAFEVSDIEAEIDRLLKAGYRLINEEPRSGADNKRICFLHPKYTGGVLIELCQEKA